MDFSMFEDLPEMQRFLKGQNEPTGINDLMNTLSGMNNPTGMNNSIKTANNVVNMRNSTPNDSSKPCSKLDKDLPLAMSYVPYQEWDANFNTDNGFSNGTIFPKLDLPFTPEEGCYDAER